MNMYYNPSEYGLTVIKDIEWSDEDYQFCQTVLWRDADMRFYVATDSGCSCPSPFEGYGSVSDLVPIRNVTELRSHIKRASNDHYFDYVGTPKMLSLVNAFHAAGGR